MQAAAYRRSDVITHSGAVKPLAWAGYSPESKRSACPLEFQSKRSVTTPTLRHMTVFKTKRENMQEVDKGTEHVPKHCGS